MADGVYYEYSLIADGVQRGSRQAVQALKEADAAAAKTGQTIDGLAGKLAAAPAAVAQHVAVAKQELSDLEKIAKASGKSLDDIIQQIKIASKGTRESVEGVVATYFGQKTITGAEWERLLPVEPLKKTGVAATGAARGMAQARLAAVSLATQSLGTNASLTRLSTALLTMGVGGAVTIAVLLGVTAIVKVYQQLTDGARKAKASIDAVIESLQRQIDTEREASVEGARARVSAAQLREGEAQDRLRRAEAGLDPLARASAIKQFGVAGVEAIEAEAVRKAQLALTQASDQRIKALENQRDVEQRTAEQEIGNLAAILNAGNATNKMRQEAVGLVAGFRKQQADLLALGIDTPETRGEIVRLQRLIDELEAHQKKADKASDRAESAAERLRRAQTDARAGFERATAQFTEGKGDDIASRIAALTEAALRAAIPLKEIEERIAKLRAAISGSIGREMESELIKTTLTQVDDLTFALAEFDKKVADLRAGGIILDEATVAQLRAAKEEAIELAAAAERLAIAFDRAQERTAEDRGFMQSMSELNEELAKATAARDATAPGTLERVRANERVRQIMAEIVKLQKELQDYLDRENAARRENVSLTAEIAGGVANVANAAFGIVSAFAGANSELAKMLGSIGQVAGGVASIATLAKGAGGLGNLFSSGAGIVSALPGLGQIIGGGIALASALFGQSPAELARIQRLRENTEALRQLTNRVGTLAQVGATGADIVRAIAALSGGLPSSGFGAFGSVNKKALEAQLAAQGLSLQQFLDIMKGLGITIDATSITVRELEQAFEALQQAALVRFGESFAGQMEQFNAALQVFPDLADPTKKFAAFAKALNSVASGTGLLGELIAGFDITTPEGVASAIEALQGLFERLQGGGLTAADLGGLSPSEFLNAILQALGILREAGPGGTGGFNIDRTITEVTGSRIGALLSTANIFAEQTAANTAGLLKLFGGGPLVPLVSPPSIPSTGASMVGGVSIGTVTVVVQVETGEVSDPEGFGRKVARGFVQQISEGQANALSWRKRAVGNAARRTVS